MGRWEPDAQGRMARAALELYAERGYEQTTVQDIAERAGVTERTYFRYFADKREVLFDGAHTLERLAGAGVVDAPADAGPLEAAGAGVVRGCDALADRYLEIYDRITVPAPQSRGWRRNRPLRSR